MHYPSLVYDVKNIQKMPKARQLDFFDLIKDLRLNGPIRKGWPNFSSLDAKKTRFHCHLDYKWVAYWSNVSEFTLEIEVFYAGSREKAPY